LNEGIDLPQGDRRFAVVLQMPADKAVAAKVELDGQRASRDSLKVPVRCGLILGLRQMLLTIDLPILCDRHRATTPVSPPRLGLEDVPTVVEG